MEHVLHSAVDALAILLTTLRLSLLLLGVVLGLVVSLIPGLGGIVGLALLLPFTFDMDPYSAMAIMMGLAAAVSHGDVIPAVLFGVPGTVGCAATVMDGYPMAKRGEAGRALGAAFGASLLGGLFGAVFLAVSIPVVQPVILLFGAPEMLATCVFGMTLVSSLSGNAPVKGLTAAALGLLLSTIGGDAQTGTLRFTFGALYLWDGLPIVPFALGIFAIPELCDIMINRTSIASSGRIDAKSGQWKGCQDVFRHWFLVMRTSALGAACAMVPGIGAPVIDWIAYGHAARTEKGASRTFGSGDVRGVIAAEASTNAREGGALIPTIAFGVANGPSMAILLGAFLIHGIVPGPEMLTKHLDITYTIVWSLTLANVLGTVICFAFSNQFARLSTVRYAILLPLVMCLLYVGAMEAQHSWGDLLSLLGFGAFGWLMKRGGWPRPPLILGFILGPLIERYFSISSARYGWEWLTNWFVLLMFGLSVAGVLRQIRSRKRLSTATSQWRWSKPTMSLEAGLALAALTVFAISLSIEARWAFDARLIPEIYSVGGILVAAALLIVAILRETDVVAAKELPQENGIGSPNAQAAMDLQTDYGDLSSRRVYGRALGYMGWSVALLATAYLIGFLPATIVFLVAFLRLHGREAWSTTLLVSGGAFASLWFVFDYVVHEPWPPALIGVLIPGLRSIVRWF